MRTEFFFLHKMIKHLKKTYHILLQIFFLEKKHTRESVCIEKS